jgi:hypothetical protein
MEFLKKTALMTLSVLCFTFCGSNHQRQMDFTQEMAEVYYETVAVDSQREAIRVNFYIEFNDPLSEEIRLQKVYFRNQQATIEIVSGKKYVAHFTPTVGMQDFVLDSDGKKEYGNKAPIIVKPIFELNEDEAILEYRKNNDTIFFKLTEVNEKQ